MCPAPTTPARSLRSSEPIYTGSLSERETRRSPPPSAEPPRCAAPQIPRRAPAMKSSKPSTGAATGSSWRIRSPARRGDAGTPQPDDVDPVGGGRVSLHQNIGRHVGVDPREASNVRVRADACERHYADEG